MNRIRLDDITSVSGQLSPEDVATLSKLGVKSIICNRPDKEEAQQFDYQYIEDAAKEHGLEFAFMPVISGQVTLEHGDQFAQALADMPHPIHAYCRSGMRCTTLWALAEFKRGKSKESILENAAAAGYNLTGLFQ